MLHVEFDGNKATFKRLMEWYDTLDLAGFKAAFGFLTWLVGYYGEEKVEITQDEEGTIILSGDEDHLEIIATHAHAMILGSEIADNIGDGAKFKSNSYCTDRGRA